ncbi:amidase [Rhizobium sp. FKL33]|uniref:amidase n=1 Tax=Rhizobium sp. FKL33 TaxID=2562307 RepID=UPI001485BCC7|nr:amidase [Rhizobium sp. FKL33]
MSLGDLLSAYTEGALSPVDYLAELVSAIETNPFGRQSVLRLAPNWQDLARDSARRWERGRQRPLEGLPFGVKDIIDVRDAGITCGSHFTGDRIAPCDAHVVERLRAAGAIPLAITATTEFAAGSPHNPRFGAVTNPWDEKRWTGGSSTGSGAALAARLMPFALGTDTGGSIRVPSCWCGVTGLKPSRELVSRQGVAPLSWTLDHVGPMARNAIDLARVLPFMTAEPAASIIAGCEDLLRREPTRPLRIGVPQTWFTERVDRAVLENWGMALKVMETLGHHLVDLPALDIEPWHEAGWIILQCELAALQGRNLDRAELFDPGLLLRLRKGLTFSAVDYLAALQARKDAQTALVTAMKTVDVMITPGIGGEAGRLDSLTVDVNGEAISFQEIISRNTMIFDFTGFPALMAPSGFGAAGLPTGIQIVARPGDDILCLEAAISFQGATDHHRAIPPGAGL